jgi:hypothetical protein
LLSAFAHERQWSARQQHTINFCTGWLVWPALIVASGVMLGMLWADAGR